MNKDIISIERKQQLIANVAIEMMKDYKAIQQNNLVNSFVKKCKEEKLKTNAYNALNVTIISALGAICLSANNIGILGATMNTAAFIFNGIAIFNNTKKAVLLNNLLKDSNYSTVVITDKIKEAFKDNKYDKAYNFLNYFFDKDKINEIESKAIEKARKPKL